MQVDRDGNYLRVTIASDPKSVDVRDEETIRQQVWEAVSELSVEEVAVIESLGWTRERLIDFIVDRLMEWA